MKVIDLSLVWFTFVNMYSISISSWLAFSEQPFGINHLFVIGGEGRVHIHGGAHVSVRVDVSMHMCL